MEKKITNLHCDKCENGILQLIITKTKSGVITASSKDCNGCGKPGGFKTFSTLTEVRNPGYKLIKNDNKKEDEIK